jgi:hypothetical protein
MTNYMQLGLLKEDVDVWNNWRKENPQSKIELVSADLAHTDLSGAQLSEANLSGADLRFADLTGVYLREVNLSGADLSGANLNQADCRVANFTRAILVRTNLKEANLLHANLGGANLGFADLERAILNSANLVETNLQGASLIEIDLGDTIFARVDLSNIRGLETAKHNFPSAISTDTIQLSKGRIPAVFLRGCGLSDVDIEYAKLFNPDISNEEISRTLYRIYDLRANQAVQISPLFISYSHDDSLFVDKLDNCLTRKGIRFWRDIHNMKSGRMERQIDLAIRQNPTVLLVLSEHSFSSDWVEHEVRTARELEKDMKRDILCPVALDHSWKDSRWPKRVMEQIMEYNILDFSEWQDNDKFDLMFRKLIDGLELFYKS